MITYELAKKLKDAGFPQNMDNPDAFYTEGGTLMKYGGYLPSNDRSKIPTLSELIEACGRDFRQLIRKTSKGRTKNFKYYSKQEWTATQNVKKQGVISTKSIKITRAPTPEEAVANLWLELNKSGESPDNVFKKYILPSLKKKLNKK